MIEVSAGHGKLARLERHRLLTRRQLAMFDECRRFYPLIFFGLVVAELVYGLDCRAR